VKEPLVHPAGDDVSAAEIDTARLEFVTSAGEMERRLRAYTTLIGSLLAGVALSSIDFLVSAPMAWTASVAGLAVVLALTRFALIRSLRNYLDLRLQLGATEIERIRGGSAERFPLADVVRLVVTRTKKGGLREITARLRDGRHLSVNGIEDFERLGAELRMRTPAAAVSERSEPVDYDHPLFYVIFGVITGAAFTFAIRGMSSLSTGGLKRVTLAIAVYSLLLGGYVFAARPLTQRYGPPSRLGDILLGSFCVLAAILLAAYAAFGS